MTQITAMIIGATSMLSQELAKQLAEQNVRLILLAQDTEKLSELANSLPSSASVHQLKIDEPQAVINTIKQIWQSERNIDLAIINTGLNGYHSSLPWQIEQDIIQVNVQGFAAICNTVFAQFREQGYGQLAAINSIAGLRGGSSVAFHASKAFASNYLDGLSMHAQRLKLPITISDIQLGLLDKAAMQGSKLWYAPVTKVASQILAALKKGKRKCYITKRWQLVAWLTLCLPEYIYNTRHWKAKKR